MGGPLRQAAEFRDGHSSSTRERGISVQPAAGLQGCRVADEPRLLLRAGDGAWCGSRGTANPSCLPGSTGTRAEESLEALG